MASLTLESSDLERMIRHWLSTPPNGYLGSGYGSDPHSLLQQPNSSGLGDAFINKMIEDIPVLKQLPAGTVNVYFEQVSKDTKRLLIEVGSLVIPYEDIEAGS